MHECLAVSSVSIDSWEKEATNECKWLGRKVIDIGTVSALKHWLCRLIEGL